MSLVFISCGQYHPEEIALGRAIADEVNSIDGLTAYFAQNQATLEGLTSNIFGNLNRCAAFIAVMQERGRVSYADGDESFKRASVWIEQEIAIASFIQHTLGRQILAFVYIEEGISLEGVRDKLLLNAQLFSTASDVLEHFKNTVVPDLKQMSSRASVNEDAAQNRESPLGQIQFGTGPIATEPKAINPDFQFTLRLDPWSYGKTALTFDDDDEKRFGRLLQDGRLAHLSETVFPKKDSLGIAFSSRELPTRSDNLPIPPAYQVYIRRDGFMVFQFAQGDKSPYVEVLELLLQGFTAARAVFSDLSLKARAYVRVRANLHAGRQNFQPTLAAMIDVRAEVDLDQSFSIAFTELVCEVLSSSGQPFKRSNVSLQLDSAWARYLGPHR